MAEYHERRTVIETEPTPRVGQVETQHEHISYERRGMSGAAVTAIVLSAIAAAVLLTLLFTSNRDDNRDDALARERIAEQPVQTAPASQPPQQSPVIVTVPAPQTQPTTVTVPVPVPVPVESASSSQAVTDTSIEVDVISKLTDDAELRSHPINVKFNNGTITLSGLVPREGLKARAEIVAKSVKGVTRVVNDISVQGQ